MNILIYIEPHIIRERRDTHQWIVHKFIDMLAVTNSNKSGHRVMLYAPKRYLQNANKGDLKAENILTLPALFEETIDTLYSGRIWDSSAIDEWVELMRGTGAITDFYYRLIEVLYQRFAFDVIVYWGTNGAVMRFGQDYGVQALAMELGCTRPPFATTYYLDPLGVNGAAITRQLNPDELREDVEAGSQLANALFAKDPSGWKFHDAWYAALPPSVLSALRWTQMRGRKTLLLPLQLMDDANVLLYSPYASIEAMLEAVLKATASSDYDCLVKPHPAASKASEYRWNYHSSLRCKQICHSFAHAIWLEQIEHRTHYIALLRAVDAVVTLNSSVGFEAMMLGKLVSVVGDAPYRLRDMLPDVTELADGEINAATYRVTINRILSMMLLHYLVPEETAFSLPYFITHVQRATDLGRLYARHPERLTRAMLRTTTGYMSMDDD